MTDGDTLAIDWIEAEAHFWSLRWLFVLCLVAASGVAAFNVWRAPPPQTSYSVSLEVYAAGTPVRGASEIADILRGSLAGAHIAVASGRGYVPVVVNAESQAATQDVLATAQKVADQLDVEVQTRMADLANVLGANDAALPLYLGAKSYLAARKGGMIQLIRPVISNQIGPDQSLITQVGLPIFLALTLFIAVAMASYGYRRWTRFRNSILSERSGSSALAKAQSAED